MLSPEMCCLPVYDEVVGSKPRAHSIPKEPKVPVEVHAYAAPVPQMGVGQPGKVGILSLLYERARNHTRLGHAYHQAPLHRSRPLYLDPRCEDMVFTYVISTGGGILQGDRLTLDVTLEPQSRVHLTTQSATKVYRMEHDYAVQQLRFHVGADAYLEWIPDPVIPYRNSRLYQTTEIELDPSATLILSDILLPGREGELFEYDIFFNRFRVTKAGRLILADSLCLEPTARPLRTPALMADYTVFGSLYILTPLLPPEELINRLVLATLENTNELLLGFTILPDNSGVLARCIGNSPRLVQKALRSAWNEARVSLLGSPIPERC